MIDPKKKMDVKKVDTKEFELPETFYIRDIENRVFQGIALQCLSKIQGIELVEGGFIDNILGRTSPEGVTGIIIEQDSKNYSVGIKIEVNVYYGYSIPEKAEQIQADISNETTKLTGLHVSYVHVVFKNVVLPDQQKKGGQEGTFAESPAIAGSSIEEEYLDEF
jgi:uncharacterized alkaline shock family protein YloU